MHQVPDFSVTIDVPDGKGGLTKGQFSTREFMRHLVRTGKQFNSDYSAIRLGSRIEDALDVRKSGPIDLDSSDWEIICEAAKAPQPITGHPGYPLSPGSRCVPLVEAVIEAKQKSEPGRQRPGKRPKRRHG